MKPDTRKNNQTRSLFVLNHKDTSSDSSKDLRGGFSFYAKKSRVDNGFLCQITTPYQNASKSLKFAICATFLLCLIGVTPNRLFASSVNLDAIKQIESSGNPFAFNKHSQAIGLFQITPICLKDFNQLNNYSYSSKDLLNPAINKKIASWYLNKRIPQLLRHFKYPVTTRNILVSFNCGVGCLNRASLPKETLQYLERYKALNASQIKELT